MTAVLIFSDSQVRSLMPRFRERLLPGCVVTRRFDSNGPHHSSVFVFQKVAMIGESSYDAGAPEVYANLHAGINGTLPVPVRNVDCVAQIRLVDGDAVPFQKLKMCL